MGKKNKKKKYNHNYQKNNYQSDNGFKHQSNIENNNNSEYGSEYPSDNNVYDAEKVDIKNSPKKTFVTLTIVIFLAFLLTFIILFTTGLLKKERFSFLNFSNNNYFALEDRKNDVLTKTDAIKFVENIDDLPKEGKSVSDNLQNLEPKFFSRVSFPVLMNDSYEVSAQYEKVECDHVYWINRQIEPTTKPLNATYREMFNFAQPLDFYVGNYVAKQNNLNFDYAEIENRIAKVYLSGSVNFVESDCDRLRIQLTKAAMQFNTVGAVEIYLNGKPY